jgi:hypothetical protein
VSAGSFATGSTNDEMIDLTHPGSLRRSGYRLKPSGTSCPNFAICWTDALKRWCPEEASHSNFFSV